VAAVPLAKLAVAFALGGVLGGSAVAVMGPKRVEYVVTSTS
jgi:hypothetical protein